MAGKSVYKSQHMQNRSKKGGQPAFLPDIKEWKKACGMFSYNNQISKHFGICVETLNYFLDREWFRQEREEGYQSEYLRALKDEKAKTREFVTAAFLKSVKEGDTSSIIFAMKVYNGMIEPKDQKNYMLKKQELALKTNQFLSDMASKFNLNAEELKDFVKKYFKNVG